MYYKCHKINLSCGGSYIDSPDWVKNKRVTINPINKKDNKCFQYAVTVTLNHEEIKKDPQKITKIKSFINKYNWEGIKIKFESHKTVCEHKYFCNIIMPSEDTKTLEFNRYQKSDKAPIIIYADLECLIEVIHGRKYNTENLYTKKVSEQVPLSFSMFTISSFKRIENKHDVYRGKDCMKKFCESLREHAM